MTRYTIKRCGISARRSNKLIEKLFWIPDGFLKIFPKTIDWQQMTIYRLYFLVIFWLQDSGVKHGSQSLSNLTSTYKSGRNQSFFVFKPNCLMNVPKFSRSHRANSNNVEKIQRNSLRKVLVWFPCSRSPLEFAFALPAKSVVRLRPRLQWRPTAVGSPAISTEIKPFDSAKNTIPILK